MKLYRPAVLLVSLCVLLVSPFAAAEDYLRGDRVMRATYAYGSAEEIPGSEGVRTQKSHCHSIEVPFGPEITEHDALGLSYAYFLADDVAVEIGASVPLGAPGQENLGLSVTGDYYFGRFLIPLTLGYRGDLDSVYVAAGGGYEWLIKQGIAFRLTAQGAYLEDRDLADRWAWKSEAAIGLAF